MSNKKRQEHSARCESPLTKSMAENKVAMINGFSQHYDQLPMQYSALRSLRLQR